MNTTATTSQYNGPLAVAFWYISLQFKDEEEKSWKSFHVCRTCVGHMCENISTRTAPPPLALNFFSKKKKSERTKTCAVVFVFVCTTLSCWNVIWQFWTGFVGNILKKKKKKKKCSDCKIKAKRRKKGSWNRTRREEKSTVALHWRLPDGRS